MYFGQVFFVVVVARVNLHEMKADWNEVDIVCESRKSNKSNLLFKLINIFNINI